MRGAFIPVGALGGLAVLGLLVGCGSLLDLDDNPGAPGVPPTEAGAESGPVVLGPGAAVDAGPAAEGGVEDPTIKNPGFGECGTDFVDGFDGTWTGEWGEVTSPGSAYVSIVNTPTHGGTGSVRFKTVLYTDAISLGHELKGACPLHLEMWFRVTSTSGQDNSGLIEIARAGPEGSARIVLQDTRLRFLEGIGEKGVTLDYKRDDWNHVVVEYFPKDGELTVQLNADPKRVAVVAPGAPTFLRIGVRGAVDGNQGADEGFIDDLILRH